MMMGLRSAPQTTMFNWRRPTRRRLYLQPMFSFRAVNAWMDSREEETKCELEVDAGPGRKYRAETGIIRVRSFKKIFTRQRECRLLLCYSCRVEQFRLTVHEAHGIDCLAFST